MSAFDRLLALSALQNGGGGSSYDDTELRQMIAELQTNEIKHINQDGEMTFEELVALGAGVYYIDNDMMVECKERTWSETEEGEWVASWNDQNIAIRGLTGIIVDGEGDEAYFEIYNQYAWGSICFMEDIDPETDEPVKFWELISYMTSDTKNDIDRITFDLEKRITALEEGGGSARDGEEMYW